MSQSLVALEQSLALAVPFPGEWNISVSFGKSRSSNFERALFLARKAPSFHEEDDLFQAKYSAKPKEYLEFIKLYEMVSAWKSTFVAIRGEQIDRKLVGNLNYCYGDKCRSGNKDFCYGASPMTENPFGCHRLQISACNHPWWSFGEMDTAGIWHVDIEAMCERIESYAEIYAHCPSFFKESIIKCLQSFPSTINPRKEKKWRYTFNGAGIEPQGAPGGITARIVVNLGTPSTVPLNTSEALNNRPSLFRDNDNIARGVQWVSTLDEKTCLFCGALDGKSWDMNGKPLGGNPFILPSGEAHSGCRCSLVPITKTFRDMGIDLDEFPAGTRASKDGQVSESMTYEEWLATQSVEFQKSKLGEERFVLWKSGRARLSDFLDREGGMIPIEDVLASPRSDGTTVNARGIIGFFRKLFG